METLKVWRHNLHEEMLAICQLVAQYPFVAMDTEFPGKLFTKKKRKKKCPVLPWTLSPPSLVQISSFFGNTDNMILGVVIYPTNSCENEDYGYQLVKP